MTFDPTPEQFAILDLIVSRTHPVIVVEAGPGCAKTTTIEEAIKLLAPGLPSKWKMNQCEVIYTAFNKDVVQEMIGKLSTSVNKNSVYKVDCPTFNALGMRLWSANLEHGKRVEIDVKKNNAMLRSIQDDGRYSIDSDEWDDLISLMRLAKSQGYLPRASGSAFKSFLTFEQLCEIADVRPAPHYQPILETALLRSIRATFEKGLMDFDDQLYMSAFFGVMPKPPKHVFVDEAQDLTPVQLFLLSRIKPTYLVLIGDPMQAIYAFRGAMSDSFRNIYAKWPDAAKMPLQTSFRVPQNVLPLLQQRNPDLRSASTVLGSVGAPDRSWTMKELISPKQIPGTTMAILCRNNAPLYRVALACMASNITFAMNDSGWGSGLIRDIKRVSPNLDQSAGPVFLALLGQYWLERVPEDDRKGRGLVLDKIASVESLIDITQPSSVGALCITIASLLKKANPSDKIKPLLLSTAHKAKGLEFDFVVHLDSHLIPAPYALTEEELTQEFNIAYVINSRTKRDLLFVDSQSITIPGAPTPRRRPDTRRNQPI